MKGLAKSLPENFQSVQATMSGCAPTVCARASAVEVLPVLSGSAGRCARGSNTDILFRDCFKAETGLRPTRSTRVSFEECWSPT